VSIVGALHPDELAEQLKGDGHVVAARFLFTWPAPPANRALADTRPAHEADATAMLQRISAVVAGPGSPLTLAVEEETLRIFDRFLHNAWTDMGAADSVEAAWTGKGRGVIVRLAGILALLDWSQLTQAAPPRAVAREQLEAACRLWRDYFARPRARCSIAARPLPSIATRVASRAG
jgi:hypothetical protein